MKSSLLALTLLLSHVSAYVPHPEFQSGLSINDVTEDRRNHWMRLANEAIYVDGDHPCPQAPFGSAIVNTTSDEMICFAANKVGSTGDPTMHGEISTIRKCTEVLTAKGLTPQEILKAWKDFSLYTNGEPCPMCMAAIRWSGFREVIYGTSIATIAKNGRNQILISSAQVLEKSYLIPTSTLMLGNILTEETDILFSWQFNQSAPCPTGCSRGLVPGKRVSECQPVENWREVVAKAKGDRGYLSSLKKHFDEL